VLDVLYKWEAFSYWRRCALNMESTCVGVAFDYRSLQAYRGAKRLNSLHVIRLTPDFNGVSEGVALQERNRLMGKTTLEDCVVDHHIILTRRHMAIELSTTSSFSVYSSVFQCDVIFLCMGST